MINNFLNNIRTAQFFIFLIYQYIFIKCDVPCSDISDCYNCTMCKDLKTNKCNCEWAFDTNSCSYTSPSITLGNWYQELEICPSNIDQVIYCSDIDKTYNKQDLDARQSLIFQIKSDDKGNYGKKMLYCKYNYIDDIENDYIIKFEFSNQIKNKPKIYYLCASSRNQFSNNIMNNEVTENKQINCYEGYTISFYILLTEQYSVSPLKIELIMNDNTAVKYIKVFIIILSILIVVTLAIYFCIYYYRVKSARELQIALNEQARHNMIIIQQENNNINNFNELNENIEEINKAKLDKLFAKSMMGHLYKKEYNQYGGGCSICLENFKKKSTVSVTPCNHVFHFNCIKGWLYQNAKNPKCPNCNKEVLINDKKNKFDNFKIVKVKKKRNEEEQDDRSSQLNINRDFSSSNRQDM